MDKDMPYLTLAYGNGPGFDYHYTPNDTVTQAYPWRDVSVDENRLKDPWYQHISTFTKEDETHGGEDVAIYAKGPNSHLIKGVIEQNFVAHLVSYSACIGPQANLNEHCSGVTSDGLRVQYSHLLIFSIILYYVF